jgi:type VI secretion system secreted protein VgrG
MPGSNKERLVEADTPLGDKLWFRQMTGTEALSTLFEYDVTFHSDKLGLKAKAMLGLDVTLRVETQDLGVRHFNGLVTRFAGGGREGEHYVYTAKLRPWLWIASRRSDCKIFQFKTVPEIIDDVLKPYGFPMMKKLVKTYRQWDYCVQYQETDLNFVMRLMEHEGIYFHFEHMQGKHTLVFDDDTSSHKPMPERPTVIYSGVDAATVEKEEHFDSWHLREEVDPGEYETDDYDFKHPSGDLTTNRKDARAHAQATKQRYMWPGGYVEHADGETYANVRMQALVSEQERAQGHCWLRTMATGYLYTLAKCPLADQNRQYLAVAATYFFRSNARMSAGSGDGDSTWGISVTSQPTSVPYRPQLLTAKPLTHGPQTAVVVGPDGEEIYTDDEGYGRVKVQFHWDRYGKRDENSSCWIRVSMPWAGEKWGFVHIPRIGQEVVVNFIGGDPDHPIITGSVYNAEKMPPYALPANKTASGIKSRSTKGGTPTDFNEIRMEDKKGEEQLYIHAQRNHDTVVELDESRTVGQHRQTRVEKNDSRYVNQDDLEVINGVQNNQIEKDQTTTVKGNQRNTVTLDQSNMVKGGLTQNVEKDVKEETGGDHQETVKGNHNFSVTKDEKIMIQGQQSTFITGNRVDTITGDNTTTTTGKTTLTSIQGYSVFGGLSYGETCVTRSADVKGTDTTKILGMQTETIDGLRSTTIKGGDTTSITGVHSHSVTGVSTMSAAAGMTLSSPVSITVSGTIVTITGASMINMNAPIINMNAGAIKMTAGVVLMTVPAVVVTGAVTAAISVISPLIGKCPTNIV